jgi:hypothetical protein
MPHNHPMTGIEEERAHMATDLYNRLHFLHWAIDDTQETVRFLDTKAAFCVTLLSGMVAVALEHPLEGALTKHILFPIFIVIVAASLMVSLRVIFPIILPHGTSGPPASPKFFIGHNKGHHWIKHTISNPRSNVLSENSTTYLTSLHAANDEALLTSMSETVVILASIRQIKSDRLHSAMYCLATAIVLFGAIMMVQNLAHH